MIYNKRSPLILVWAGFASLMLSAPIATAGPMWTVNIDDVQSGDTINVQLTVEELMEGPKSYLKFSLQAIFPPQTDLDIRALFFNVADASLLAGLDATGTDVSGEFFSDDGVWDAVLGFPMDAKIKAEPWDVGIIFGVEGDDNIISTVFELRHATKNLFGSTFFGGTSPYQDSDYYFGLRAKSIVPGPNGSTKTGSLDALAPVKLPKPVIDPPVVPEPASLGVWAIGLASILSLNGRRRRRTVEGHAQS